VKTDNQIRSLVIAIILFCLTLAVIAYVGAVEGRL